MSQHPERPLTLADIIDLELALAADRDLDVATLRRRDARITARLVEKDIEPRHTAGPPLFLAWLDQLRNLEGSTRKPSAGRHVERMLSAIGLTLALVGFLLGFSICGGWLLQAGGRPVNVVFFLAAVLGTQMPLLALWLAAIVPAGWRSRLPGAEAIHWLWSQIAQVPPRLIGWIAARMSRDTGQLIGRVRGEVSRLNWIYGPLKLWLLIRLTQVFALAANAGLIVSLILLSYVEDPAFGWKSTLMSPEQLHAATRMVAVPWRWLPEPRSAVPTLDDITQSRFWSSADKVARAPNDGWSRWWPFLVAALVTYGLLPRLVTLAISHIQVRRSLRAIRLDHSEFARLAERLVRPQIDTRATTPESPADTPARFPLGSTAPASAPLAAGGPIFALTWAGVQLPRDLVERTLVARLGGTVAGLHVVGGLDPAADARAIAQVRQEIGGSPAARAALLVEAWEPPVGDYVDFIRSLRAALGPHQSICVLLFDRDAAGQTVTARATSQRIWRDRLAQLGDPWLRVESLIDSAQEVVA